MKTKLFTTIALSVLLLFGGANSAEAAQTVQVTLPSFDVTLNGQTHSNTYSKYPFIVYKDITYFPMTYYDSRLLGLTTAWSAEEGLAIAKQDGYISEYLREVNGTKNKIKQTASIVEGKITVNGTVIDNSREEYPLLLFRDVTYFPLTWRFAVDEFGWDYQFSHEDGLVIVNGDIVKAPAAQWQGIVDYGAPIMGTGELMFGVGFQPKQQSMTLAQAIETLSEQSIALYYFSTLEDVEILDTDKLWEYQIYRIISGEEHLVYSKVIPFYSGALPSRYHAYSNFDVAYWTNTYAQKGNYKIVLSHPDMLLYRSDAGDVQRVLLQDGTMGNLFFESIVEIK